MKKKYLLLAIFLFFFLPKNTFAATSIINLQPKSVSYWTEREKSITGPASGFNIYNTFYYGYNFSNDESKIGISFNYETSQAIQNINKVGTINFVIYNSRIESYMYNPFRVYIKDYNNNITSCTVQSTKYDLDNSKITGSLAPVICPDAYIDGPFSVYIADSLMNVSGIIALSNLTFKYGQDDNSVVGAIQQNTEQQKKTTEAVKEQTETIKDSDTSGSKDSANSFFSGFEDNDYGLSDIIKMPLTFIKGLASSKCSNLRLPLPLVDKTVELPCMTSIYGQYFGPFLTLYQTITTGIIAYWCCVNILKLVQGFKNPDNDEVEVMDL